MLPAAVVTGPLKVKTGLKMILNEHKIVIVLSIENLIYPAFLHKLTFVLVQNIFLF